MENKTNFNIFKRKKIWQEIYYVNEAVTHSY